MMTEEEKKSDDKEIKLTVGGEKTTAPDVCSIDLVDRDPKNINDGLTVDFQNIFAEPHPTIFAFDGVWKLSYNVFKNVKLWWYRIITLLCAVPASCCWGLVFACIACNHIWCLMPMLKAFQMKALFISKLLTFITETFCKPCFETLGYCFSKLKITIRKE